MIGCQRESVSLQRSCSSTEHYPDDVDYSACCLGYKMSKVYINEISVHTSGSGGFALNKVQVQAYEKSNDKICLPMVVSKLAELIAWLF